MTTSGRVKKALRNFNELPLWRNLSPFGRKIVAGIVGGLLLLAGIAMIILPGPAIVVIPLAIAILGTQFAWPKKLYHKVRALWCRGRKKHA